jgi:hypothetical protein
MVSLPSLMLRAAGLRFENLQQIKTRIKTQIKTFEQAEDHIGLQAELARRRRIAS